MAFPCENAIYKSWNAMQISGKELLRKPQIKERGEKSSGLGV